MSASSIPAPFVASNDNGTNSTNSNSMTIRSKNRRVSTSPPPPSLERKFELLEARFTQPLGSFGSNAGNASNSAFSSPKERFENCNSHSNLSEHSFSFSGGTNSNQLMTVRSKRRNPSLTSLDIVNRAAAKHMRKVAANSPVMMMNDTIGSNFSLNSNSNSRQLAMAHPQQTDSNTSNSQQTVVTGNKTKPQAAALPLQQAPNNLERVVAESPPVLISPAKASTQTKPKAARTLPIHPNPPPQPGSSQVRISIALDTNI